MVVLRVVKGENPQMVFPVGGERTVVGRHPACEVVLQSGAVSRHHCHVLESHGVYYVEDLRSRNGTYLNGDLVDGRLQLRHADQIRICDVTLLLDMHPEDVGSIPPTSDSGYVSQTNKEGMTADGSGVATLDESQIFSVIQPLNPELDFDSSALRKIDSRRGDGQRVTVQPETKLKAILEITRSMGRDLETDAVLPQLLTTLFNIFPHADQGFVLLKDADSERLKIKATRARGGGEADAVAVSMTVVRYVMHSGQAVLSGNVSDDSRFKQSTSLARMRVRSMMCVPLLDNDDETLGVIQIVSRDETREFADEDLDLLESVASQASLAVQNARLHEEALDRRALERDLEFATQVQLGFLPKSRPKLAGYEFSDYYEAALRVGGDYFDYIQLPNNRLALCIGDVAGKGMPAALLMARLYSSARLQLLTMPTLVDAVAGLNAEIASSGLGHRFITYMVMVIDIDRNEIQVVNAGHLAPALRRADGTILSLGKDESGLPLGILPDQIYRQSAYPILPGDMVLAFTDGITEAMAGNREIYGRPRLEQLLSRTSGNVDEVLQALIADVEEFAPTGQNRDDICVLGFQCLPGPSPEDTAD